MKKQSLFFILVFMFVVMIASNCTPKDKSEGRFLRTETLKNGLYLECYEVTKGGVFTGNTYGYYLSDSNNFLQFIGFAGDNEVIDYRFEKDSSVIIITIKSDDTNLSWWHDVKRIKLP